jgi:hypothetical protein
MIGHGGHGGDGNALEKCREGREDGRTISMNEGVFLPEVLKNFGVCAMIGWGCDCFIDGDMSIVI